MRPTTRPARADDGDGVLPDRWAQGGDRRSFVAELDGAVLGHCRGVDSSFHPGSRTFILQVDPDLPREAAVAVAEALTRAQLAVSALPLRLRIGADDWLERRVMDACDGVVEQVLAPWCYRVGPALRAWAATRAAAGGLRPVEPRDEEPLARLWARHYAAQHARWAPSAAPDELRRLFAKTLARDSPDSYDRRASRVLERDGELVAAALVWPEEEAGEGREVNLVSATYEDSTALADKDACLADVVGACEEGEHLLLDTHMTEPGERILRAELPPAEDSQWTLLVALPCAGGQLRPFPAGILTEWDAPAWVRGAVGPARP